MTTTQTRKLTAAERTRVLRLRNLRDESRSAAQWDRRHAEYDALLVRLMDKGVDPSDLTR